MRSTKGGSHHVSLTTAVYMDPVDKYEIPDLNAKPKPKISPVKTKNTEKETRLAK